MIDINPDVVGEWNCKGQLQNVTTMSAQNDTNINWLLFHCITMQQREAGERQSEQQGGKIYEMTFQKVYWTGILPTQYTSKGSNISNT